MIRDRLKAGARKPSDDDRILPLINVVFLLLIFFMLAGKLTSSDPFRIDPPASVSTAEAGEHVFLILIGADGRIAVNGETTDPAGVGAALSGRARGVAAKVSVKADGGAPAALLVETMEHIRTAGIDGMRLLTVPGAAP
jgi:biopolymer transport protein ExbD